MSREIFWGSGIGLERLLTMLLTLGLFFLAHMAGSFQETGQRAEKSIHNAHLSKILSIIPLRGTYADN